MHAQHNHETKLFPLAQESSCVEDANKMVLQRKIRLDGVDDSDDDTPAKDPTVEHAAVEEAQDNDDNINSGQRVSKRLRAITSASNNKGCSPPLILSVHECIFLCIFNIFYLSTNVSFYVSLMYL